MEIRNILVIGVGNWVTVLHGQCCSNRKYGIRKWRVLHEFPFYSKLTCRLMGRQTVKWIDGHMRIFISKWMHSFQLAWWEWNCGLRNLWLKCLRNGVISDWFILYYIISSWITLNQILNYIFIKLYYVNSMCSNNDRNLEKEKRDVFKISKKTLYQIVKKIRTKTKFLGLVTSVPQLHSDHNHFKKIL